MKTYLNLATYSAINVVIVSAIWVNSASGFIQNGPPENLPGIPVDLDLPDWVDPHALNNPTIIRSRPIDIAFDVIYSLDPSTINEMQQSAPVQFELFDDLTVTAIFDKAKPRWENGPAGQSPVLTGYTWRGWIVGEQEGSIVMITEPGMCAANIHIAGSGWFKIRSLDDLHVVREIDGAAPLLCDVQAEQGELVIQGGTQSASSGGCDDGSVIDLIVVYTEEARLQAELENEDIEIEIDMIAVTILGARAIAIARRRAHLSIPTGIYFRLV